MSNYKMCSKRGLTRTISVLNISELAIDEQRQSSWKSNLTASSIDLCPRIQAEKYIKVFFRNFNLRKDLKFILTFEDISEYLVKALYNSRIHGYNYSSNKCTLI